MMEADRQGSAGGAIGAALSAALRALLLINAGVRFFLRHVFSLLCLRIVRMARNALCRSALRLCAVVRILRIAYGFASVADDAQAGSPGAVPTLAGFAGFAWVILREGSFLPKIPCGGRERGTSIASGCKPRFAGFAVCTRFAGLPAARQKGYAFYACRRRKLRQALVRTRSARVRNARRQKGGN